MFNTSNKICEFYRNLIELDRYIVKNKNSTVIPLLLFIKNEALNNQILRDIKMYVTEDEQTDLFSEIKERIEESDLSIKNLDQHFCILKAMAAYGSSRFHYGPVLAEWTASLLDTALVERRKLIFLARDGIAPYKAAQILKKKLSPKYDGVDLSLISISRSLAYSATQLEEEISSTDQVVKEYVKVLCRRDPFLLRKYILQETRMRSYDRCLFVDVGFSGSVIHPITSQLEGLGIDMRFNFLISHTSRKKVKQLKYDARGFLAHREKRPLPVVDKAGGNPAIHWIEDTHQSVVNSAKLLMVNRDRKIVPATVEKVGEKWIVREFSEAHPQTCRHNPEEFLVKTYGLKGALDGVHSHQRRDEPLIAWREASESTRMGFGEFLHSLHTQQRLLYLKH